MNRNGSKTPGERALHPLLSLTAAVLGAAAMLGGSLVLARHLSLRPLIAVGSVLLVVPALLAILVAGRRLAPALALRPLDRRTGLLSAGLGLALWGASLGLLELQYVVWPPPPGYLEQFRRIHEALRPANALDAILSVLAIAAAPAICEETLVRGVLLPSFRRILGAAGAVVASAAVFALIHDPYRYAFAFAVGLALGAIRLRAGALLPCMVTHATLNTLTFVAAPFVDDPTGPMPDPRPGVGTALFLAGLAVAVVLLRRLRPAAGD